jgi:hypothetical protein
MTTIEHIAALKDLNEYLDDDDINNALEILIGLITKPDVAPAVVGPTIVKLQAIAAKCKLMASMEAHVYKKDRARKNLLFSVADALDNTVAALKYLTK